jgi:hypothetical protein
MKKYFVVVLASLFFVGCVGFPKLGFKLNPDKVDTTTSAAAVVKAENTVKQVDQMAEANKKVDDARNQLELQYAKFRADLQKAYDDAKKKDDENFAKIGTLDYGIYIVTQEKKKQDINTLVAHLRAKEILARTDKLSVEDKAKIAKEVEDEKTKTIDQLYEKYNASVELAISQKADLDKAEALIEQKEKEKQQIREEQRLTINKLEAEQKAQLEKIKKDTADQVEIAKANQKAEMLGYIIKALVGVGILFLILAVLLKSVTLGIGCLASLGLAYVAATIPMWVVGAVIGGLVLLMLINAHYKAVKDKITKQPAVPTQ